MTIAILRPNSTITANSTGVTGAATRHAALSDDSDASYLNGPGPDDGSNTARLGLGTVTLPAGSVLKQFRARIRTINTVGRSYVIVRSPTIIDAESSLMETATVTVLVNDEVSSSQSSAWITTQVRTNDVAQPIIDALVVDCFASNTNARIREAYADVMYVAKPVTTITAITPDPYTASTLVPVSWSNTLDSDGGAQIRYQLQVYLGSVAPANLVYDTGEVLSATTAATVGPLTNGTYVAQVRVAQTVNGTKHWSSYSTDTFTVTVATSTVASVTATPNNAAGKIALSVARSGGSQAWEFIEIERSIDAGTTWSPVRGATFVDATGNANTFTIDDYETPNGQATIYRARATWYSSGLPITGAWVQSSSATWTSAVEWLKSPFDPTLNVGIDNDLTERVTVAGNQRSTNAGVFQVLGRADAITVADVLSRGTGALTLRATGRAQMLELDAILESTGPLLLNLVPDSMSGPNRDGFQYVTVLDVNDSPVTQYSLGNDEEMRLYEVTYANGITPPDETAGSV